MLSVLRKKRIILGVTGGGAAYKACEIVRRLNDVSQDGIGFNSDDNAVTVLWKAGERADQRSFGKSADNFNQGAI